jgi:hypothetical protein
MNGKLTNRFEAENFPEGWDWKVDKYRGLKKGKGAYSFLKGKMN